jgi:hypothetical protein
VADLVVELALAGGRVLVLVVPPVETSDHHVPVAPPVVAESRRPFTAAGAGRQRDELPGGGVADARPAVGCGESDEAIAVRRDDGARHARRRRLLEHQLDVGGGPRLVQREAVEVDVVLRLRSSVVRVVLVQDDAEGVTEPLTSRIWVG